MFFLNSPNKPNAASSEVLVPRSRPPVKPMYTVRELANALRLQPGTIRNKLSRGEDMPRSILLGRRRLFPEGEVEAWLLAQETRHGLTTVGSSAPKQSSRVASEPARPPGTTGAMLTRRGRKRRETGRRMDSGGAQIALFGKDVE